MSKYGVISSPYFPVFSPNKEKHGPEITPYLENFYAAKCLKLKIETVAPGAKSVQD